MSTERYTIEKAFAMINECFDRLYNNEPVKSAHDWGSSTLEMIDDAMRVYERGVKRIDKRLSGSGNESKLENRIKRIEYLMRK